MVSLRFSQLITYFVHQGAMLGVCKTTVLYSLQEAARITVGGAGERLSGGGMTPTGVKEEEGSVWRRKEEKKPLVNLTKRLRKRARTVGGRRGVARDAAEGRTLMDLMPFLHRTTVTFTDFWSTTVFLQQLPTLFSIWQVRSSRYLGMFCALEETWWRGGKFRWDSSRMVFSAVFEG